MAQARFFRITLFLSHYPPGDDRKMLGSGELLKTPHFGE
jgi:hypothetical protein